MSIGLFAALICVTQASASGNGTIIVQQNSYNGDLAKWTLETPDGRIYADHRGEHMEKIHRVPEGLYTISIESPTGTASNTEIYIDEKLIKESFGDYIAFRAETGVNVRIVMTHLSTEIPVQDQEFVSIELTSNQDEVLPGGSVMYTLSVTNLTKSTIRNIEAYLQYDPSVGAIPGVSDRGSVDEQTIVWDIPNIFAGQTWNTQFEFRASENAKAGEQIAMHTSVGGEGFVTAGIAQKHMTTNIGVSLLPKAGYGSEILLAGLLASVSLIFAYSIRRKRCIAETCYQHVSDTV